LHGKPRKWRNILLREYGFLLREYATEDETADRPPGLISCKNLRVIIYWMLGERRRGGQIQKLEKF
jgi:hypothetical protein